MRKDRADAAEELGDGDDVVALCLGAVDPLQRCGANLRGRGHATRAERGARAGGSNARGARSAGVSKRRVRNKASGVFVCVDGWMRPIGTGRPNALNRALLKENLLGHILRTIYFSHQNIYGVIIN
jgi:hypothetical protein